MGLNLKALKGIQEDLQKRGEGNNLFFYAKEIGAETDVRLLPPLPHMNGIYFVEQIVYWINGKPYTSPETFDEPCPIEAAIELARESGDADVAELLDSDDFKKKSKFLMPILLLDCEFGENGECTKHTVIDGKAKILDVGPMLMKRINKVVTSRNYQNGTEDGIMDAKKGFNIILSKTGKKLDTEYDAIGWNAPLEMEEKFYKNIPDVITTVKKGMYDDDYLTSVVENYLYGDEMLDEKDHKRFPELQKSDDSEKHAKPAAAPARGGSRTGKAEVEVPTRGSRGGVVKKDEEEEDEKPARRAAAPPTRTAAPAKKAEEAPKPTGRRNLLKDLDNID